MSYNIYPPPPGIPGLSSSTDKAVVRWDGTAGSAVENSAVIISDVGDVVTPGAIQLLSDDVTHYCELLASAGMATNVTLRLPVNLGSPGEALSLAGDGSTLNWYTPLTSAALDAYKTALPFKSAAQAVAPGNIDMGAGNPGTIDGVDFTFGGIALLPFQNNKNDIGLWVVDIAGTWTRESTMPSLANAVCAIVPVFTGGTLYGNTIWFSVLDGSNNVVFLQIPTAATPYKVTRLTTTQRDAFTAVNGDMIYNTTLDKFQGYQAGAWTNLA